MNHRPLWRRRFTRRVPRDDRATRLTRLTRITRTMNGATMKKSPVTFRAATGETTMANGDVLTDSDFDALAIEAETTDIDVERLLDRQQRGVGRPALGNGISPVLQVRLDEQLNERAERDHTTPSRIARDAIQAFLLTS